MINQGSPEGGSWSGIPAGLTAGMQSEGAEVVHIDASVPREGRLEKVLRMSWTDRAASRSFAVAGSYLARRGVRQAGPLDGVVMIGSGYALGSAVPYVTFDDGTVAQALDLLGLGDVLGERVATAWRRRQARVYRDAFGCCLASEWAAASVRDDYGIDPAKVHVVGFGVNLTEAPEAERDWNKPRFLFAGFDWERKRGPAVVGAFAEVRKQYPEAALDLVGGHPPIEAEGVTTHGPLPLSSEEGQRRYAELLAKATCMVMPSTIEPFGIAYLDAAQAGIPSIGTTIGGAADAIGDGGRLVDPTDPDALVEAMMELAQPALAQQLGGHARERAKSFTWQAVARRVLGVLLPESATPSLARVAR
ncbi:MAG: glycosyltransferase family 4 protein [Solirubrobacterales bacterium]